MEFRAHLENRIDAEIKAQEDAAKKARR